MLKAEDRMEISVLARHGSSIRAIARATGLSRNTVRRYLRGVEEASVRKASAKLDPFKVSSDIRNWSSVLPQRVMLPKRWRYRRRRLLQ